MSESQQAHRKDEHLSLGVNIWRQNQRLQVGAGFNDIRWLPNTFPEMSIADVNLSTTILNHHFDWPFYIEAMTGGSHLTGRINGQLAQIAKKTNLAMAVGSQSIALKESDAVPSFKIARHNNPEGFLIANLGADHPIENVRNAIDMIDANAIEMHVNVGQELVMAEGDREFYWLENLATIIAKSPVPVIIKEVGFGMSDQAFEIINQLGPAAVNVGGANGTNFAVIERRRNRQPDTFNIDQFGLSTVESLLSAQLVANQVPLVATGGIQSANDIVTSLMLGASLTSSAGFMLATLMDKGETALIQQIEDWQRALPRLFTLLGAKNVASLQTAQRLYSPTLQNFINQRQSATH
ncbi:MAG: type 2 isopentenyl-diphosphate Delta-isomerase [Leuconostoc gelidum]|jgi:isopentenyl-diphosphate delta-isomerase|uniref:type 2 isopentenyl-diphosphate Delta-isomerase n=1 Tax=Leuconostoc gelidum TaxID=1244 RepID=UPI000219380E|nr:type 2 isopentenyl-diphosphate Delta-isomerase [Leuconostoc gelidum]MBZ5978522.1 type 2 isopentenyl-diphosphate Delta-isomerase [Leuconostoc gelidum subsp. gelidum]MBZ5991738.1 type 2 isopentenyl-diphosphate Delta-isomerase [Leuconostoc gelidum subsp. gelidum]MBZ6001075.1 type 2 isopentenyl-diphosphate Delta-isomerase [Leuconostoc gelidum subsp. gelidum]QDJ29732.1 type 2 isopentenyl-diphosphate Delta-isomerase [Leuconostoc gelidum subsp. gelidum]USP17950.1 type 2 isopentenyl-diphosphate Del